MYNNTKEPGDRRYQHWINALNKAWENGWKNYRGWEFESPSGTFHDLSAADFEQLDRIEREGLFQV